MAIISRTNASYDGGIFLTGINQILGPHQSLATIVLVFILTVKNIGPANNISRTNPENSKSVLDNWSSK